MATHRATRRRWPFVAVLALAAAVFSIAATAFAYFATSGAGTGSATTGTLAAATAVTASSTAGSSSVSVSWTASAGEPTPDGYYVVRTSGNTSAAACGTSAEALTNSTSCMDTSVAQGTYSYTVTAVYRTWSAVSQPSDPVTVIPTRTSVTIDQAAGQADPTNASPVTFTVTFSSSVTGFSSAGVSIGGSAPGTTSVGVSGSGATYTVTVSGMTGTGTVTASVNANAATDSNGAGNTASTSTDNSVLYDVTGPSAPSPGATANVTSGSNPVYVSDETVTLTDAATDADAGVKQVDYYYCPSAVTTCGTNGMKIGTSTSASSFSTTWATPLPTEGAYKIVALVTDNANNVSVSDPLSINIDKTAPSVSRPIVNGRS